MVNKVDNIFFDWWRILNGLGWNIPDFVPSIYPPNYYVFLKYTPCTNIFLLNCHFLHWKYSKVLLSKVISIVCLPASKVCFVYRLLLHLNIKRSLFGMNSFLYSEYQIGLIDLIIFLQYFQYNTWWTKS